MKFKFKAKTESGEIKEGIIDSSSQEAAVSYLQNSHLLPISIENVDVSQAPSFSTTVLKYYESVSQKDLMEFFRQLSILIEARVSIIMSLTAISEQTSNKYLGRIIQNMIAEIENGSSFSTAMEKQGDVFSSLSINIIRAGETSGNLKKSVDYVTENIERNYNLSSRVKSALIYPAIVLVVFFVIGFLTISFIIPKLTQIIKDLNAQVPWYTKVVITLGDFMNTYWWAAAIVILGFVGSILYYLKTDTGKREWDQIKIRLPIVGTIFRYVYITRFAENLAVLMSGGIPILRSLTVVSSVLNNIAYEEVILKAAEEVKIGGSMSNVLRKSPLIPPMVSHMVRIGEESGQIDTVLMHIAKFYDQETEVMTKNLSSLLEPIIMVIIGLAVGFMAFAILMPIYNMAGQIQ